MRVLNQISLDMFFSKVQPALTKREDWVLSAIEILGEASIETVADHYKVGQNVISGRITGLKRKRLIFPTERKLNKLGNMTQFYSAQPLESIYEND